MRLNIIDPETIELVGVLTQYESVQWQSVFNTQEGSFQIVCDIEFIDLLRLNMYVENTEEPDHIGVIKRIETVSSNIKTSISVSGTMLESDIFSKRIIPAWIVYESLYPTTILTNIIGLAMTAPADPQRKMNKIGEIIMPVGSAIPDIKSDDYSSNFANLGEEVFNILKNLNLGVKARINRDTKKIDIEFYTGNDLTHGSDNPILLSPERGTVLETDYTIDCSQNVNMLTVIGSDNVILQAKKTRDKSEPLVEKSIDLSSELQWPSYRVERPDDEGGQYYRYKKKAADAGFIANRDVWERYNVERIDTTEKRYKEVFNESEESVTISNSDFSNFLSEAEILSGVSFSESDGFIAGSIVDMTTALTSAIKEAHSSGKSTKVGALVKKRSADFEDIEIDDSVVVDDLEAESPPDDGEDDEAIKIEEEPIKVPSNLTASFGDATLQDNFINSVESGIDTNSDSIMSFSVKIPRGFDLNVLNQDKNTPSQTLTKITRERQLKEVNITNTTYEIKDFLEYVYVNHNKKPSQSSKIAKGSVSEGDVIYYENFKDEKIEEVKYREMLFHKAEKYLKTFVNSESVEVKPYMLSGYQYKKDYNLGDIVTTRNHKLGYSVDLRISGITETWDSGGYDLRLTLGDNIPTLTNRIKLIARGG